MKKYFPVFIITIILLIVTGGISYYQFKSKSGQNYPDLYIPPSSILEQPLNSPPPSSLGEQQLTNTNSASGQNPVDIITPESVNNTSIPLSVISPLNGSTVGDAIIIVKGRTAPNTDVSINESDIRSDSQGNYTGSISLDEGENIITVTAIDDNGNSAETEISVTYDSGQ